ncbi:MAG TPA: serine/threonine protein kinase [Candidatus Aminicenantes bacterium]|nr:serine/threonine protein kinase [Candidatus Aminicenantes bacterium]
MARLDSWPAPIYNRNSFSESPYGNRFNKQFVGMKRSQDDSQSVLTGRTHAEDHEFVSLPAGTRITKRYRVVRFLGKGGFATVYEAVDEILNEKVALKVFHQGVNLDRNSMLRIKREISLSRRIADPRVVKVFSLDRWLDRWFLVMELVEGETLKQRLDREGAGSWQAFQPVFLEILAGISALHALHFVHRDIKPSNIMLVQGGGVKILDFGLAKDLGDPERSFNLNEVVGTPRYLSPEQLQGVEVGVRSDVFQLGLLLQTVLRGSSPLEGMDTLSVLAHRMGRTPVALRLEGLRVPTQVRLGLERSLRRLPGGRFRDAAAMHAYFSSSRVGRRVICTWLRKLAPGAALLLMLGVAAGALFWTSREPAIPARVRIEGNLLKLLDERGAIMWAKDFSPRSIYRAVLQPCRPPLQLFRSNHAIHHLVTVFFSAEAGMDQDSQPTLGSTESDARMMQIDTAGNVILDRPLSVFIRAGDYGFIPRSYIEEFQTRDLDGDGSVETIARVIHARGMFPSAFLFLTNGRLVWINSPGHIGKWTAVPEENHRWRFFFSGRANRMGHLDFVARIVFDFGKDSRGGHIGLIPHLNEDKIEIAHQLNLLAYFPQGFLYEDEGSMPHQGPIEMVNRSGVRLRIEEDGTMRLGTGVEAQVFVDPPERLRHVYTEIQKARIACDLHSQMEEAAARLERAAESGVENPWLQSVIALYRGDVEVRRGRYASGRRLLRRALGLYPQSNDAVLRLLETAFLEKGPEEALHLIEAEFRKFDRFWGLTRGRDFFKALCLLQKGDFESARLFSQRMQQDEPRNAALLRSLTGLMCGDAIVADLPRDNGNMSLLYTWEEYRLLEGRAHLLAGDGSGRGEFCFHDVNAYSRVRRHLAAMSLAWYTLKDNRRHEAERMASEAFTDLEKRIRGDMEARFWWFYDAWVYGRVMDELGRREEARRGYEACIAANPHTALAAAARQRLAGLQVAQGF